MNPLIVRAEGGHYERSKPSWAVAHQRIMKIGMSLRGARPRSNLGIMRVRLLPLRFAQGRNDTWGIYFRNKLKMTKQPNLAERRDSGDEDIWGMD